MLRTDSSQECAHSIIRLFCLNNQCGFFEILLIGMDTDQDWQYHICFIRGNQTYSSRKTIGSIFIMDQNNVIDIQSRLDNL